MVSSGFWSCLRTARTMPTNFPAGRPMTIDAVNAARKHDVPAADSQLKL